ncbi:hypothetical protein HPB50_015067 [Hyalomma asiaticum]|uniref:Uncharacterized protein n=1 Tax=Hyalomma asiaticum TaxID=266040 RepID=A0ACB7SYM8_HYAAI|nr:hypothetical protein HPB50_015067 [Hyalomma asiaticum]
MPLCGHTNRDPSPKKQELLLLVVAYFPGAAQFHGRILGAGGGIFRAALPSWFRRRPVLGRFVTRARCCSCSPASIQACPAAWASRCSFDRRHSPPRGRLDPR